MSKKYLLLYPFLFSLYPGLALVAQNLGEMEFPDSFRSLIVSLLSACIFLLFTNAYFRNWTKSALLTTVVIILFFTYGHMYNLLRETTFFGVLIFRHRVLGFLWFGLLTLGFWAIDRKIQHPEKLIQPLTIVALVALAVPLWNIVIFQSRTAELREANASPQESSSRLQSVDDNQYKTDIYYIILDAYSRDDYLLEYFGYDNSEFLNSLRELGFYVAQCSQSNYSQTRLSLASSLNMNYIEAFYSGSYQNPSSANVDAFREGLVPYLKDSAVRSLLEEKGYSLTAFETGWSWSEMYDADHYLQRDNRPAIQRLGEGPNAFEVLFIRSTALSFLTALSPDIADLLLPDLDYPNKLHRDRVLFILDSLSQFPMSAEAEFVFAHIVSPHVPFVFGPNGETLYKEPNYRKGYPDQVQFLNGKVLDTIESILTHSFNPPIIVLQADHGARDYVGEEGRMAILNAFYLPKQADNLLYSSISPVNSFRMIFNQFFGQSFELLDDVSLFSPYKDPLDYSFIPQVGERCQ